MIQPNQYCVISIEIWLKCRVLLEFSWFLKNYKRLIKALLKIKLFRIDLNIVFCKESKILCKITLGIGFLTSVVRVSVRFPVNTCCTTKDKHGSWKPLSLWMWPMAVIVEGVLSCEKKKSNIENQCVVERGYPFVNCYFPQRS